MDKPAEGASVLRLAVDNGPTVNDGVVDLLKKYLDMAENGQVVAIGIGAVMSNGDAVTAIDTGGVFCHDLNSAVSLMGHRLCAVILAEGY